MENQKWQNINIFSFIIYSSYIALFRYNISWNVKKKC